eukprot:c12852_g1_i1 orf=126-1142(-)
MGEQQIGGVGIAAAAPQTGGLAGSAPPPMMNNVTPMNTAHVHQFRDTTYTKVFVGGLAWETQRDTMRRHFEQYGEIVEAVVIMDKNTGRSKGYGFVTFRDAEGARRACLDATPVIDGRRANCNLASLGAHRSRPSTPLHGSRMIGGMSPYSPGVHGGGGPTYVGNPAYSHQPFYPNYHIYGFSPYAQDYGYQQGMYNPYGVPQYPAPMYAGALGNPTVYNPYGSMQLMQGTTGGAGGASGAGGAAFPFSTSSPGGSSTNSSGGSYHGGTGAIPALSNMMLYGGGAHSGGIASMSAQQQAPPLLSSAGVMAAGSSLVIPSPAIQQHLAATSVIAEQPSA